MNHFKYDIDAPPLSPDQIRLIKVHEDSSSPPSADDNLIICDLETWQRGSSPPYIALSYAWENHSRTRGVRINGKDCQISDSVEQAIQHLRNHYETRHVWVDQLCINQDDDKEKSFQVQQMRHTYQEAEQAVAWLGLEFTNSEVLFEYLTIVGNALKEQDWKGLVDVSTEEDYIRKLKDAFCLFCERQYWKRLWVIQEFAVAKKMTIACGSSSVDGDAVYRILVSQWDQTSSNEKGTKLVKMAQDITARDSSLGRSFVENVVVRREVFRSIERESTQAYRQPFITVLSTSLALELDYNYPLTSDPRDRVFSLLNLATDASFFSTFPDYSKTCEEVYTEVAAYFLQQGYIDVLVCCQFPRKLASLPSWAPDWSMEIRRPCCQPPRSTKFIASGDTLPQQRVVHPEPHLLELQGFVVDKIKEVGDAWDPDWLEPFDPISGLELVNNVLAFCKRSTRIKASEEWVEAHRIAAFDGVYYTDSADSTPVDDIWWYHEAGKMLQAEVDKLSNDTAEDKKTEVDQQSHWYTISLHRLHSRRPFLTPQGFVGMCPMQAQAGDVICVMLGAKVPTLIRPQEDGSYHVVGEAYVHGIMFGEMLKGEPQIETIRLS